MALSDLYDDLDAYLCEPEEGEPQALPEPLALDGQQSADRALRRLARVLREERNVRQVADAERERIKAWEEDRLAGLESRRRWLEQGLESFMRAVHAASGTKSLSLPWGRIGLRKGSTSVAVIGREEDVARALMQGYRHLVRVKAEVAKAEVAKALVPGPDLDRLAEPGRKYVAAVTIEGEVVEGLAFLVPTEDSFSAKPTEVEE